MVYGVQEGKGFIVITGDVGAGKTMLVQALKKELGEQHQVIEIATPWVSPEDILSALRTKLGIRRTEREEPALLDTLKNRLIKLDEQDQRVVLVIDEAHQIPERTLEGIRLLSNLETNTRKLIQVILLGQDELATILSRYSLRQVQQRIALNYHLQRLDHQETEAYIQHRLRIAGGDPYLFPKDCIELIYKTSLGSPRVINQVCDNCLLFAFGRHNRQITLDLTSEAIGNLLPERQISPAPQVAAPVAPTVQPTAPQSNPPTESSASGQSSENVLPFQLPSANSGPATTPPHGLPLTVNFNELRLKHLLAVMLLGLGLGATGVVALLGKQLDWKAMLGGINNKTAPPTLPDAEQPIYRDTPRDTTRGMQAPSREDVSPLPSPPAAALPAANPYPAPAPATSVAGSLQLPGGNPLTGGGLREITVTQQSGLSAQATNLYGIWNDSVRDLIATANPGLTDLERIPTGTRIRLPVITRDSLVVQDATGRFFVYFGSFEKPEAARTNLEALRRTWSGAMLTTVQRPAGGLQRLYIGVFNTKADADSVAGSLWLKHLPTLN